MRRIFRRVQTLVILGAIVLAPSLAIAQERASLEGFGGLSLNSVASETMAPSVGGTLTFSVTPAFQIVGEAGRLGNVLPTMSDAAFSAADLGMRVSALYGEGGARLGSVSGSELRLPAPPRLD